MCNINIIVNKSEKYKNLLFVLNSITKESFKNNNDGEGFIEIDKKGEIFIKKDVNKIKYNKEKINIILTHQRKSTSGFGAENTHPHESKNFLMLHNGVIFNESDHKKSDSRIYLDNLQKIYNNLGNTINSIKKSENSLFGSYSIVLFDKKHKNIYYYKNDLTSMYFIDTNDVLIMSTDLNNMLLVCNILKIDNKEIKHAHDNTIYEISKNGLFKISNIVKKEYESININFKKFNFKRFLK